MAPEAMAPGDRETVAGRFGGRDETYSDLGDVVSCMGGEEVVVTIGGEDGVVVRKVLVLVLLTVVLFRGAELKIPLEVLKCAAGSIVGGKDGGVCVIGEAVAIGDVVVAMAGN